MRSCYADYAPYGIGAISRGYELHVFASESDRDAWVRGDPDDYNPTREAIDAKEARRMVGQDAWPEAWIVYLHGVELRARRRWNPHVVATWLDDAIRRVSNQPMSIDFRADYGAERSYELR